MPLFPILSLNLAAAHLPVSLFQTIQQFTVLVLCLTYATECKPDYSTGQIPAASNITLILVKWFPPAVKVQWHLNQTQIANVKEMQIFYNPVKSSVRSMIKVSPDVRQVTLKKLQPNQEYELELLSVSTDSMLTNSSSIVNFISPSNESSPLSKFSYYTPYSQEEIRRKLRITMDEIVILIIVLCVWLTVICIFCSKWSKLRHLEPYHPDYRPSLGSTANHSPAYSVDSDNLANVGALTTTPVASGGLGDMTDEEDDGLLISNTGGQLTNIQPMPCIGIHSTAPLFAQHTSCAHALDAHSTSLPVCTTLNNSVIITNPAQTSANYYDYDQENECSHYISVPINATNQQTNNTLITSANKETITSSADDQRQHHVNQVKKQVQFQNIQPTHAPYIAQFTPHTPATFVMPVSLATPHLGDLYCHGTAIAYNTNYSSIDSTTSYNSYNSTSFASCNQLYGMNPPSLAESLEQASVCPNNVNTDLSSECSLSFKKQPSVESIYIELPPRYHVRSNSTPSEDVSTVIFNTPSGSSINKHSPVLEEEVFDDELIGVVQTSSHQLTTNRMQKSKSDGEMLQLECTIELNPKKCRSLELNRMRKFDKLIDESTDERKSIDERNSTDERKLAQMTAKKYSHSKFKEKHHYHSVGNIVSSIGSIPDHSLMKRYYSSIGLKRTLSTIQSDHTPIQNQPQPTSRTTMVDLLKRKRKNIHQSDHELIVMKGRTKLRNLNDEFTSSLPNQMRYQSRPSLSETTSSLTATISTSEQSNQFTDNRTIDQFSDQFNRSESVKCANSTDSGENESVILQSLSRKTGIQSNLGAKENISLQSEDSLEYERTDDESTENRHVNRLDSIQEDLGRSDSELDQLYRFSSNHKRPTIDCKMQQSATMYNIRSLNDSNYESSFDQMHITIRRHQSAEQMLKKFIENIHHFFRNHFKS